MSDPPHHTASHHDTQSPMEDADLEAGRKYSSPITRSSFDTRLEEKDTQHDSHRPTDAELLHTISRARSRGSQQGQTQVSPPSGISRRVTTLSRMRTQPGAGTFSHALSHIPTNNDVLVDFDGKDDPYHPQNWPTRKKVTTTMLYGFTTMSATWASSAYSAGTVQVAEEFHVGRQVAVLGTSLFLAGFGLGPLLWAPLSEVYGRRIAVLVPMFVAVCFSFASATAKDFQTLMLTRFWGAFFSSAPVTNTGGVLGDLWSPEWRGMAMAGYAMAVVGGPCLGELSERRYIYYD
jgi:DHA1 family multidrug resistance protein-like MFS transporter